MPNRFFDTYMKYIGNSEAPVVYHRWSIITCVAAALGRKTYIPLGHYEIDPHMYTILIGGSGARKNSAILPAKKLLEQAGYHNFAANRTSKEKFISDLQEINEQVPISLEDEHGMGDVVKRTTLLNPAECFIAAPELGDFLGQGNIDFITMLGTLWDGGPKYDTRIKSGKSNLVHKPGVSLLGGSTPTGFGLTFPPEIIGQGFSCRLLLVYGERTADRITWPDPPNLVEAECLIAILRKIRHYKYKNVQFTTEAKTILDRIYHIDVKIPDPRFERYIERRFIHLLKICLALSVMETPDNNEINANHAKSANTLLCAIEARMPKALGEFGRSKFSEAGNTIMEVLSKAKAPLTLQDLWKIVAQDLTKQTDLAELVNRLIMLGKIQVMDLPDGKGFITKSEISTHFPADLINADILTEQELIFSGLEI